MSSYALKQRFDANWREQANGCWLWVGSLKTTAPGDERGGISVKGKSLRAHRVAYELYVGEIPDSLHVLHTCDNTLCVNPGHLFLGTHADNMRDKKEKGRASRAHLGKRGEEAPNWKLTDKQTALIKMMRNHGYWLKDIAREFDCSEATVCNIFRGKNRVKS